MGKEYGQFCGLARAAEVVGERWTLLILRDLSVGPARFSELKAGLPGIAATVLTARLRDLEAEGIVTRTEDPVATVYALSELGEGCRAALKALSLWGACTMDTPRRGEHATDRSLAAMLATTRTAARVSPFVVEVHAGGPVAHAHVTRTGVTAHGGSAEHPDLTLSGPGLRHALAHPADLRNLIAEGVITAEGSLGVLDRFAQTFYAPLNLSTAPDCTLQGDVTTSQRGREAT